SLMMEGLSYIAGTELPVVLIDVVRGGPGLGNIAPSQGDYNQIVHGGGHGDYHPIVLAPSSVQEAIDYVYMAFDLAEKYRSIVIIMVDGNIGQMMEPTEMPPMRPIKTEYPDWAVRGAQGREPRILTSIYIDPPQEEVINFKLAKRWLEIEANEIRYKEYYMEDAEFAVIGFGTAGRISLSAVRAARAQGINIGLFRPISLSPYPYKQIEALSKKVKKMLVVEMNAGQMLEDVQKAVKGRIPIAFYGRMGGITPFPDEILNEIQRLAVEEIPLDDDPRRRWLDRSDEILSGLN
ncbi:MAG: 3-methyl-2-oxobutanoate dehydrogenase subunit beta, partial [Chloroflexi bacterium]|nr:3-methyl-2-oxobutanoate dehydrogenase subunit beta [Chloroflexota bacterium]